MHERESQREMNKRYQRESFCLRACDIKASEEDVFVLRILDIVHLLGIADEIRKKMMDANFNWHEYEAVEHLARLSLGVWQQMMQEG